MNKSLRTRHGAAFTLIELLVVLAIIAVLASLALPKYFQQIDTAKDTVLAENLRQTRETIDKFYADTGKYPDSLEQLVEKKYLRALPLDPVTDSRSSWVLVPPDDDAKGKVANLTSSAPGKDHNGVPYDQL